jgi:hypothetical protein
LKGAKTILASLIAGAGGVGAAMTYVINYVISHPSNP